MDKKDKIFLLQNKKDTFGLILNQQIAILIALLIMPTSICATAILTFNQNKITISIVLFYILFLAIFLPKPIKEINNNLNKLKRIDSFLFTITKNESIEELFVDELYR